MRCLNMVDEAINNPTRLGHPLKRVGKRGENKWEQISWDEAYDMIEEPCPRCLGRNRSRSDRRP